MAAELPTRRASLWTFLRQITRFRLHRDGAFFSLYLTHWFYLSNRSYPTEKRYFVRVGQWRRSFGGIRV